MEEPAVSFKCNPNFPWMKCLKGHTFGFDAEHITGYIKFYNFNRFGNPVFKYEQIAINIFWRLSNYIQYSTKQEEWFWEDNICLMIGYPRGKPKDPLDVVNISRFKTPEGSMARGNFQTFQLIKKEVQFFHPRDISERLRKYISHLIICNRKNNLLRDLPIEIIFIILTFLRKVEMGSNIFYPLIKIKWNGR